MRNMPKFNCYMDHASKNYGLNALCFEVDGREFYFSYQTLVAFRGRDGALIMRANVWGPTTGKHLNAISTHVARYSEAEFMQRYEAEIKGEK